MELKDILPFLDPEVLKRWTELQKTRDWNLVDWTQPKTFTELANIVRNSGLGGDVREALAKMFEEVSVMVGSGANEEQARQILDQLASKIEKGQISWADFSQEVREILAGTNLMPTVGKDSVANLNIVISNVLSHHIKQQEIKPINTSFIKTGNNLANFIYKDKVIGGSANASTDYRVDYVGGFVSDKIPVLEGETYTLKGIDKYLMLTKTNGIYNNVKISGAETVITIPSGVTHLHVDTFGAFVPFAMVNKGGTALPYEHYKVSIPNLALPSGTALTFGKKVDFIGDSILEKNATATTNTYDLVVEALGLDGRNLGVSGTGYANNAGSKTTFHERALTVRTDADLVVFCGSGNDISSGLELGTATDAGTSTIAGCINTAIDNAIATAPKAKIAIVTSPPWQSSQLGNDEGTMFGRYITMVKTIAYNRGIDCLDLYHKSGLRPWEETFRANFYKRDNGGGTHPDEDGHRKFMYPPVREFIQTQL